MLASNHTICFDTFLYKAATGNTGSRVDNSGRGNTNDNKPGSPEFLMITKRTNGICLCVNRFGMFSSPARLNTVLSNRKNLTTMKDHGDVIVCTMFGSIAGKLAKNIRLNIPLYVGRKHHIWILSEGCQLATSYRAFQFFAAAVFGKEAVAAFAASCSARCANIALTSSSMRLSSMTLYCRLFGCRTTRANSETVIS